MKLLSSRAHYFAVALVVLLLGALYIHNTRTFPLDRGFDASGHLEYVRYIQNNRSVPLPIEGWELWQPPLYYAVVAILPTVDLAKGVGLLSLGVIVISGYVLFRIRFSSKLYSLLGSILIASTPVLIYLTPTLSNELFSASLISAGIVLYILSRDTMNLPKSTLLGVILGLALLAKATAILLITSIVLDQLVQKNGRSFLYVSISFLFSGAIAGWFYLRNLILYKNPFAASFDFPIYHPLHQTPVDRNLSFFTTLKPFLTMDLFGAHHYAFFPGTYFSWFFDAHHVIVPVMEQSKIGIALIVLSLPLGYYFLKGAFAWAKTTQKKDAILIIYPILLAFAYILYNIRLPFYSTVKGVFLISAIIPITYVILWGFLPYKRYTHWAILYLVVYSCAIVRAFWIQPGWY